MYFITFIDDFTSHGWIELLCEKFEYLDDFKAYKAVIKLKLGMKIMCVVRSNKGGEFYDI